MSSETDEKLPMKAHAGSPDQMLVICTAGIRPSNQGVSTFREIMSCNLTKGDWRKGGSKK
jgi:hypothetical protein